MHYPKLLLVFLIFAAARANAEPLVSAGDTWRYRKNGTALPAGWRTTAEANLSASWQTAAGGFGYADNTAEVAACITPLTDMEDLYSTIAIRKSFAVTQAIDPTLHLYLRVDFDDGFIAWLDGTYLASSNVAGAPNEPAYNALATANHESSRGDNTAQAPRLVDLGPVGSRLAAGTHILAVMGLNVSLGSSDFVLMADLFLGPPPPDDCKGGTITANTVWSGAVSVCTDVTIASDATLTIDPGTIIHLSDGVDITVASGGRLIAEGTANSRIRFMAAPTALRWGGIEIDGAASTPETRIAYADFADNGKTAIHTDGATVYLDHLNFETTDKQYVSLDGSSFILSNCHFPKATARFEPVHGAAGIKAGGRAIMRRNYFGGAIGYNDIIDFTGGNRPGPILHFINNVVMNGDDDGLDLDGTDAWVEGNLFLKLHRNGGTPDSASAISGGSDSTRTSEVTIVNNLFFDCDNITTGKQGNFYSLINNTIVRNTRAGGIDTDSGVVVLREVTGTPTAFALGAYLEGNIIADAERLERNYDAFQTAVTFRNNLLPTAWTGPGSGNIVAEAALIKIPTIEEASFTNWSDAQRLREWLAPQPGSSSANYGAKPIGAQIHGSVDGELRIGFNRASDGIPLLGWPLGSGYTHYKWRLDGGGWSPETAISIPLLLPAQPPGAHSLEVTARRDSGTYQDDPAFGEDTIISALNWSTDIRVDSIARVEAGIAVTFQAAQGQSYSLLRRASIDGQESWTPVATAEAAAARSITLTDATPGERAFYLIVSPAR